MNHEGEAKTPEVPCLDKALQLLALRAHFEGELRTKLVRRGYDSDNVEQVLTLLRADGTLDDRRVAGEFVAMRQRRRGEGRHRLRAELVKRRVADDIISDALSGLDGEVEADRAIQLALQRSARGATEASVGRFLNRKGFEQRVILQALEECRKQSLAAND